MANLNRIILIGRLTADPESRSTMEGLPMTKFHLSVDRPQGGADLIDIVTWRNIAEAASQTLKKGNTVLVEGSIQIRTFNDQAGQKKWATEVSAKNFRLIDSTKVSAPARPEQNEDVVDDSELASDLPF
ncbi:MAG: single-stranded DNA-binding protein [bacterium]